jgi:hypothetical protein
MGRRAYSCSYYECPWFLQVPGSLKLLLELELRRSLELASELRQVLSEHRSERERLNVAALLRERPHDGVYIGWVFCP